MATVVVGVDGSHGAEIALRFAAREAKLRSGRLRVATAWHIPPAAFSGGFTPVVINPADFEGPARGALKRTLRAVAGDLEGVEVDQVLEQGQAADVLVAQARDADLLVVGTRGHGGFAGLLLGSVSQQCAHHASCPIAIVPSPHEQA